MSGWIQWTAEEDEAIRQAYAQGLYARHTAAVKALATRKGTSVRQVRYRACKLGLTRHLRGNKPWKPDEEKQLRELGGKVSTTYIAKLLGRSVASVSVRLSRMELKGRVVERGYTRYELCDLMGINNRTLQTLLEKRPMTPNRFKNFSRAEVQMWIFDLLEVLELRRFDQDFLKQMLKGAAA